MSLGIRIFSYWGIEPPVEVTAWYAVDDSDRGNGCMQVIPGTHAGGLKEHGTTDGDDNLLSINQELTVTKQLEAEAVDCILKAGQISLHDGMAIHGSLPNQSTPAALRHDHSLHPDLSETYGARAHRHEQEVATDSHSR